MRIENAEKFTGKAQIYDQNRPSYPEKLMEYLYTQVGMSPHSVIADIGAGTGIFSRLLLERGSRVLCVEPNAQMRALAQQKFLPNDRCTVLDASAEYTGLEEGSVDFVTAAQAFHWFRPPEFALECRRILRPKGKVVLVWNRRVPSDGLTQALSELLKRNCPNFRGFQDGITFADCCRDFFRDGVYDEARFPDEVALNLEQFLGRQLSSSYAPREGEEGYEALLWELSELFASHQQGGVLRTQMMTNCYVGEV